MPDKGQLTRDGKGRATVKALTKGDVFNAQDRKLERVEIPEWDGFLFVRTLSAAERDDFENSNYRVKNGSLEPQFGNMRARLVALCACDEQGNRLFIDDDAGQLGTKFGAAVDRAYKAASSL